MKDLKNKYKSSPFFSPGLSTWAKNISLTQLNCVGNTEKNTILSIKINIAGFFH